MGNTMSKPVKHFTMLDCPHQLCRRDLRNRMKAVAGQQKELEVRMKTVDESLSKIEEFKEKTLIPDPVLRALWRGEDQPIDERYLLSSELFGMSQKIAEILVQLMDNDREAATCCKPNEKK